jgi:hypothetical protein
MPEMKLKMDVDSTAAVKGVDKFGDALDDVVTDLEQMEKESGKASSGIVKDFDRIAKESKQSGDKVGKNLKGGFDDAKDEAKSSGKEAAASFDGSFESVTDFVQETIANAFEGFGPAGAVAGIAIAAAIGAALSGAEQAQEKLQEAREAASELAATLYENNGVLPVSDQVSKLFDLLANERKPQNFIENMIDGWSDFGSTVDNIRKSAKLADVPLGDIIKTLGSNDVEKAKEYLKAVDDALTDIGNNTSDPLGKLAGQESSLLALKGQLEGVVSTAELTDEVLGAVGSGYDSAAYVAQVEDIGGAWQDAATDAGDYIDQTEGVVTFDWSKYLADAEATLAAANDFKKKIVTLPPDIQAEGERVFKDQGAVAAIYYTDAFINASEQDKGRFVAAAKANGTEAGQAAGAAIADETARVAREKATGWGGLIPPIVATVVVDDSAIRNYRFPKVTIPGQVSYTLPDGRQAIIG